MCVRTQLGLLRDAESQFLSALKHQVNSTSALPSASLSVVLPYTSPVCLCRMSPLFKPSTQAVDWSHLLMLVLPYTCRKWLRFTSICAKSISNSINPTQVSTDCNNSHKLSLCSRCHVQPSSRAVVIMWLCFHCVTVQSVSFSSFQACRIHVTIECAVVCVWWLFSN